MQGMVGTAVREESIAPVSSSRDWRCAWRAEGVGAHAVPSIGRAVSHLRDCVPGFHGSRTPVPVSLRPLVARDVAATRTLADALLGDAPHADGMLASLNEALTSASDEYRAIGAHDRNTLIGFAVFGETAGAIGAGRIYCVAVDAAFRRRGIATALIEAACADLRARATRFAMIELPAEPDVAPVRALVNRTRFHEEGRVSDYFRDGVDLLILRRDVLDP